MTAAELIKQALLEIKGTAAEQAVQGATFETAALRLNILVYSTPEIPNYTVVNSGTDSITAPAYSWRWLIKALALDLAPQFGTLENYLAIESDKKTAWQAISRTIVRLSPPQLMDTVPMGSGNKSPGGNYRKFYTETDDGLLSESNTNIILEDGTE